MTAPPREPKRKRCEHDRWPGDDCDICPAPAEPPAQAATERMGTHWETCATDGGPRHYDCALRLIEQQAREIAELTAEARTANERHHVETERRVCAEAERDALCEDAERYRWLRDHKGNNREPHIAQHPYCAEIDAVEYPYFVKVGLDAAIDAARAKVPK